MKRSVKLSKAITLSAAVLLAPSLLGCQDTLVEEKASAKNRWVELRTVMMLDMARQQFATGDLTQAQKSVKNGLSIDPQNADLHVLAGRIQLERGKLERSYHLFNAALELKPKHAEACYYQGLVMQRWQRYEGSLGFYEKAYQFEPDNPAYLLAVSELLVEVDRIEEAIVLLEDKRQYFDQNAGVRAAIGHLHAMQGRHADAAEYFRQASLLEPDNTKLKEHLALSWAAADRYEQAIEVFEQILRDPQNKDRADIRRALATAYLHINHTKEARSLMVELARSPQGSVTDWIKLGELSLQEDDLGGALQAASRVINLAPHRHEGYLLAGMVWQKRGNLNNALEMFDRASQAAPKSTEPLILRGLSLQKAGRHAAAAQAYHEALRRQPKDTRARQLLAAVIGQDG